MLLCAVVSSLEVLGDSSQDGSGRSLTAGRANVARIPPALPAFGREQKQRRQMSIFCFGLNHQTAAIDVRERFAIPESALPEALARLKRMPGLTEGLIVSTCNRTEFYVTGEIGDRSAPAFFESFYRDFQLGDERHLFRLLANHCVRHLFQVAAGSEINGRRRNASFGTGQACLRNGHRRKDDWQAPESTFSKVVSGR